LREISDAVHAAGGYVCVRWRELQRDCRPGSRVTWALMPCINLHKDFFRRRMVAAGQTLGQWCFQALAPRHCLSSIRTAIVLLVEETMASIVRSTFGRMAFHGQMGMFTRALSTSCRMAPMAYAKLPRTQF
jgi:hypothetical protein